VIWLVRHGETNFNREQRLQGRIDSDLTREGVGQARAVARWFAARVDDRGQWTISASPLGRAQTTAGLIAEATGLAVATDARLTELSIGGWEGKTRAEIETLHPELAGQPFWMRSPDGEPWAEAAARIGAWLGEWAERDHHVIAVSHAGAGKLLRALYLGLDLDAARALDVPQDAVYALHGGTMQRFDCSTAEAT
jgi:probable phosphoglycerate mutase